MVKAMAAHPSLANKIDLQVQVAGPNAQKQIQQINAMVQAGAKAIVIFPISPTALNQVVRSACAKKVLVFAYDGEITEPCAHNVTIDQEEAGRVTAQWLADKLGGKGRVVMVTGVPGTSVDTQRTDAAKKVLAKYPDIKVVGEAVGMWSQAVARTELSKLLATRSWNDIDGLWMQVGCYTANAMQLEAGRKPGQLLPCAGEGSNGGRVQMLPSRHDGRRRDGQLRAHGRAAHFLRLATVLGRAGAEAGGAGAGRQGRAQARHAAVAAGHQRHHQALPGGQLGGDEGGLQRVQAVRGAEPGLVRVDLFGDTPEVGLNAALSAQPEK
ncbi:substrate-binding domain-containing protein [Achromobacter xylosoxidans]